MSPDVAGVSKSRWEALTEKERRRFVPLCPDFVLELLSASDRLADAQQKMEDWMANGCQLGWLLSPATNTAYIYCPNQDVVVYETTRLLSGEEILPGFTLDLGQL